MMSEMDGAILQHAQKLRDLTNQVQRLAAELTQLTADVIELQYLWSEEIIAQNVACGREVVADLGHGWQIERMPGDNDVGMLGGDPEQDLAKLIWGDDAGPAGVEFVHSPGYEVAGD